MVIETQLYLMDLARPFEGGPAWVKCRPASREICIEHNGTQKPPAGPHSKNARAAQLAAGRSLGVESPRSFLPPLQRLCGSERNNPFTFGLGFKDSSSPIAAMP